MSKLIIIGLIVVWAIVLAPDLLARLARTRRSDSIRSFSTQLTSLGRANGRGRSNDNVIDLRTRSSLNRPVVQEGPRPAVAPARKLAAQGRAVHPQPSTRPVPPEVRKRRQDVLVTLGSLALLTLLATVAFGGAFLLLHLLVDVLLLTYLVALAQVMAVVPPAVTRPRQQPLAPLSPLDGLPTGAMSIDLRTGSVGHAMPVDARRIAN